MSPTTRDDAAALGAISTAFLSALVPQSAAADLFDLAAIVDLKASPRVQLRLLRQRDDAVMLTALQLIDHVVWHARRALTVHDQADNTRRKTGGVHGRAQPPSLRDSPFTKREFGSFAGVLRPKVRDRYADESDALGRREDGPDQAKGDLVQPVPGFNARFY
jgi:hypothetical protein